MDDVSERVRTVGSAAALVRHRIARRVVGRAVGPSCGPTIAMRHRRRDNRCACHRFTVRGGVASVSMHRLPIVRCAGRRRQPAAMSTIPQARSLSCCRCAHSGSYRCRHRRRAVSTPASPATRGDRASGTGGALGCGALAPRAGRLEECLGYASRAVLVAGQNRGQPPPGGRLQGMLRYALVRTQTEAGDCSERRAPVDWRRAMLMPASAARGSLRTVAIVLTGSRHPARRVRLACQTCRLAATLPTGHNPRRDLANPPSRH